MSIISFALLGKNNEPIYLREFDTSTSLSSLSSSSRVYENDLILNNNERTEIEEEELLFGFKYTNRSSTISSTISSSLSAATDTDTITKPSLGTRRKSSTTSSIPSNTPVVVSSSSNTVRCSLRQQFILHAAVDQLEQLNGPSPPGCAWRHRVTSTNSTTITSTGEPNVTMNPADAMFVGLLYSIEHMRVYGYQSTTQMRFLLTIEDDLSLGYNGYSNNNSSNMFTVPGSVGNANANTNTTTNPSIMMISTTNTTAAAVAASTSSITNTISLEQQQKLIDESIKRIFMKLHTYYVEYMLNPFSPISSNTIISSKLFDQKVYDCIYQYNFNK